MSRRADSAGRGAQLDRHGAATASLAERDAEPPADDEELALAQTHAAAARTSGSEAHRPDDAPEPLDTVHLPTRRKARIDGFDLDAEVALPQPVPDGR
ncbi:MAG TPA: hypothetical protein RMH99_32580 [Sandaracinaceae bacterium LLY-WYZ-13_1]|nr:hypothetical protein [Sandaracinaceae bacterium LLY-WYZ-13_1]